LCHLQEVEIEVHFIFHCPIYYEIQGRYHCLFRELQTLSSFFKYPDQRCLALYMQEALRLHSHTLQPPPRPVSTQEITSFFMVLPSARGTKRQMDSGLGSNSKSMCGLMGLSPLLEDLNNIVNLDPTLTR
jgi:hypothetical protein